MIEHALEKAPTCLYKDLQLSKNQAMKLEGTACKAQRQDCVEAQIWGRLQTFLLHWRFPKSTVASITVTFEETGQSWSPSQTEQSGSRALERWPRIRWSLWLRSRDPMQRWEKLPEGQPSLQRSTDLGFKAEWPDGSHRIITLKHSAETTQRWLRDNSECPWVAQHKPWFEAIQKSLHMNVTVEICLYVNSLQTAWHIQGCSSNTFGHFNT